jgi:hypothetical protein
VRRSQNPKILPLDFVLIFRLSGEQPNAPNQPPGFHRRGRPSLAIKSGLVGSAALGLLGCTWLTDTAVLLNQPQLEILTFNLRQPRTGTKNQAARGKKGF